MKTVALCIHVFPTTEEIAVFDPWLVESMDVKWGLPWANH